MYDVHPLASASSSTITRPATSTITRPPSSTRPADAHQAVPSPSYVSHIPSEFGVATVTQPIPPKRFNFLSENEYEKLAGSTTINKFYNCKVQINNNSEGNKTTKSRKRRIIFESDSSQE